MSDSKLLRVFIGVLAITAANIIAPAFAEDLLDVVALAKARDPSYDAARYALEAALEKLPQAKANLLPQIALNAGKNRTQGEYIFGGAAASERIVDTRNWSLQLSQPLIRVGNWESFSQAEFVIEQARAQFLLVEQEMLVRVVQTYFDVDVARESVSVAQAQVRAIEQQFNSVKRGLELGNNAITEVYEARARLDLARSQLVAAQYDVEAKSAELEKVIGVVPVRLAVLKSSALELPSPNDIAAWSARARESAPAVKVQEAAIKIAQKEIAKNRAGHLPTLDLTAQYGRNASNGSSSTPLDFDTRARSGQIGVQLSVPLYAGGGVDSKIREGVALLNQARAQLEAAQRSASTTARQAFAGVTSAAAQVAALTSAVDSATEAVKGNLMASKVGVRTSLDILNSEQQLFTVKRDLVKARYETLLQGIKLKAAVGAVGLEDMQLLNQLLE